MEENKLEYFIFSMTFCSAQDVEAETRHGLIAAKDMADAVAKIKNSCSYITKISIEEIGDSNMFNLPYIFLPKNEEIIVKIQHVNFSENEDKEGVE